MKSTRNLLAVLSECFVMLNRMKKKITDEQLEYLLEQIKLEWLVERPFRFHTQN